MTDTAIPVPSVADRARPVSAGAPVVGVHFFGATPVFVLGEEALLFAGDHERRVKIHAGAILASASDGTRIVTGGDDGNLVETGVDGEHRILASDDKKRWIDQVALSTALNASYMAAQISLFGVVVGVALLLAGIGFGILAIGGALRSPETALRLFAKYSRKAHAPGSPTPA